MTKGQKIAFRILFFLYVAGMLYLCFGSFENLSPAPETLLGIPTDKLVHFAMFVPFPILAFLAFNQFTDTVPQTLLFVVVTLATGLLLAAGTEWGQATFTEDRCGEPLDFLADSIGLLLSSAAVTWWDIRKQKR